MIGYEYLNKYKIGTTRFINNTRNHPHRKIFINEVIENYDSVVEVGPGEMIEYNIINKQKLIKYSIVEVSKTFINYCRKEYPEVIIYQTPIEKINEIIKINKKYDIIYVSSVIEHTCNLKKFIENSAMISKRFHIVMFKWCYDGKLKEQYNENKKRWSSVFNIYKLIDLINGYGEVEEIVIVDKNNNMIKLNDLDNENLKNKKIHRNGDRLILRGKFK